MAVIMKDKVSVRGPAYFIQGDTQTQIVCFSVARYRDGVDLAQLTWSVHIKNAAGQEDVAVPHEQPDVRTDKININWLVKGVATAAAGYMTFCLRGVGTDPEGEPLRWSSGDEVREVHAAQESEASGEQADKLSELDALIEYVAKELPAVVQAGTEAKQAAADAKAAAAETNEAIDRANRLAALPDIGDPGDQGKVLAVGKGEGDAPQWILSSQINDAVVSAESTWSSKNTVERFLPEFSESGAAVECHPFPLCPLNVSTTFEPAQAGSGEPSLDNIRPISGYDKLELTLADKTENKNTYTVHLGDTVYGGTYDWSKGEMVVEWAAVAFDGTENVEINDTENQTYMRYNYYRINLDTNNALVTLGKCSHFKTRDDVNVYGDALKNTFEIHGVDFYPIFRVDRTKWPTANDWKAFLAAQHAAGTPVQIAYKLAEPITIQLAPLEIMPLEGTNVLSSNPGGTTVSGKLDPIYMHEQNKAAAAKLAGMETRLQALESAAVNNA